MVNFLTIFCRFAVKLVKLNSDKKRAESGGELFYLFLCNYQVFSATLNIYMLKSHIIS